MKKNKTTKLSTSFEFHVLNTKGKNIYNPKWLISTPTIISVYASFMFYFQIKTEHCINSTQTIIFLIDIHSSFRYNYHHHNEKINHQKAISKMIVFWFSGNHEIKESISSDTKYSRVWII